jgi:GNAT superfamily N-acetyltransferase
MRQYEVGGDVLAAVAGRWQALDPLLPQPAPPDGTDPVLTVDGGVGIARRHRPGPDDSGLLWGAADRFGLRPLVDGPDLAASLDRLLAAWRDWIADQHDSPTGDSTAAVSWPSRDTPGVPALAGHGLAPLVIIAARPAGTPVGAPGDPRVRRAAPTDLAEVTRLWLELARHESDLGTAYLRPQAQHWIREETALALAVPEPWIWVSERDGRLIGAVSVSRPVESAWMASYTSASPMAYLGSMYVEPTGRGAGVGAALVARAHRELDAARVAVTLLHYAVANPRSGPFWHRMGYRPLWTTWQARPALALR